jgi:hypothetical protein
VPRAKQKTLGKEGFAESEMKNSRHRENSRHRGFFAESQTKNSRQRKKHLAKISLPRANFLALGKEILKNHFFHLQFFSILNIHLYKTYARIWHNFIFICYI